MQQKIHSAHIANHASAQEASDGEVPFCSMPHDILKSIIQELSFKDKVSLELVGRDLHALLSHPSPTEGLWSTCNLVSDLTLDDRFYRNTAITR